MNDIPIANSDPEVEKFIEKAFSRKESSYKPLFFADSSEYLEYMSYETPQLIIINFSDTKDMFSLIQYIEKDNWMNCSGIIALYKGDEQELLDRLKDANITVTIPTNKIVENLPKVLQIVHDNQNILFQRELQNNFTEEVSGLFKIKNSYLEIEVYNNLIVNYIYNLNYIDRAKKNNLKIAFNEMLINAIEHGNCGITFDEKTNLNEEGLFGEDILKKKMEEDPSIKEKRVRLYYEIKRDLTYITITDQGEGFDWRRYFDMNQDDDAPFLSHGRGIIMSMMSVNEVMYNKKGNEVRIAITHVEKDASKIPALFVEHSSAWKKEGEVVFREGEESDYLYYIASGKYQVSNKTLGDFATLTSNDVFMGEMSFLLDKRRTATITTVEEGMLYKLSKRKFIAALKQYPYYGFLLCKILARRLEERHNS